MLDPTMLARQLILPPAIKQQIKLRSVFHETLLRPHIQVPELRWLNNFRIQPKGTHPELVPLQGSLRYELTTDVFLRSSRVQGRAACRC